jgi:hypothetical protein
LPQYKLLTQIYILFHICKYAIYVNTNCIQLIDIHR